MPATRANKTEVRPHSMADFAWSVPGGLVERPGEQPGEPEAWLYCDKFSYFNNEKVSIKTHTTSHTYDIDIIKDGSMPRVVYTQRGLQGQQHPIPNDAYAVGCGWPEAVSVQLDETWDSGFYLIIMRIREFHGRVYEREGFFIVRPSKQRASTSDFVLVHTTSTLLAYNDWGGANHYRGIPDGYQNDTPSPFSSTQRPIARGMLRIPKNAPRASNENLVIGPDWTPRYPHLEYAWYFRYSRHYPDAGWATYERPFVVWAEQQGYKIDHITQSDLHSDPESLSGYKCAVSTGHDEYWSWEMRDNVDAFVDRGGRFARFGGNFTWQVRFDDKLQTQTCYKIPDMDPATSSPDPSRCTTCWDLPPVHRPAAQTMGLTGTAGIYTRYGTAAPRSSGGFQVYRPGHWALENSELSYGDVFGGSPINICGFEVDGVDYTFRKGLPYPTGADGAPSNLKIIAMCPAVIGEIDRWGGKQPISAPLREINDMLDLVYPDQRPEHLQDVEYGSGMVASFTRNKGEVFCAGSSEWVLGLIKGDRLTEIITRNVLDRFCKKSTGTTSA